MGLEPPSRAAPCDMGLYTVGGWVDKREHSSRGAIGDEPNGQVVCVLSCSR